MPIPARKRVAHLYGSANIRKVSGMVLNRERWRRIAYRPGLPLTLFPLVAFVFLLSCEGRHGDISAKPQRSPGTEILVPSESTLVLKASVQYSALEEYLSKSFPARFEVDGREKVCGSLTESVQREVSRTVGGDVGRFLGEVARVVTDIVTVTQAREVCQDVDYKARIVRPEGFSVAPTGDKVRISVPIEVSGKVGFTGDLARALALDKKNFSGAVVVSADLGLDLDERWCPRLSASAELRWTDKARFEIIDNVWLRVDRTVEPELRAELDRAIKSLDSVLTCEDVRSVVNPVWREHRISIPSGMGAESVIQISILPVDARFSGVAPNTAALEFSAGIGARVSVAVADRQMADTPPDATPADLPSLARLDFGAQRSSLAVPLRIRYQELERIVRGALVGRDLRVKSSAGEAKVLIKDISLFPAGRLLAIGALLEADFDNRLLDMGGWIYLVGAPSIDRSSQQIHVSELQFSRMLDNPLWEATTLALRQPLTELIQESAVYSFSSELEALQEEIVRESAVAPLGEGVRLDLSEPSLDVNRILLSEETLDLEVKIGVFLGIDVGTIPLG